MALPTFSPIALDAIGEIFNISLGSSATAVSNMLARRVDITTPTVELVTAEEFTLGDLQPAICVKIDYVAGLDGSNIMLLKRSDVRAIVDILMGTMTDDEDFTINELSLSAICEVMNQMMGASSTALSEFLGRMVNISTPEAFEVGSIQEFVEKYFPSDGVMLAVCFNLNIEDAVESRFMSGLSCQLARELLQGFGIGGADVGLPEDGAVPEPTPSAQQTGGGTGASLSQEEIEKLMSGAATTAEPEPVDTGRKLSQEEIEKMMQAAAAGEEVVAPPPAPEPTGAFAGTGASLSQEEIERLMRESSGGAPAAPASTPAPTPPPAAAAPSPPPAAPAAATAPPTVPPAATAPPTVPPAAAAPAAMQFDPNAMFAAMAAMQQMFAAQQQAQQSPPPPPPPQPKTIKTEKPHMPSFDDGTELSAEQGSNLDLLMGVPVDVAVEIGRTRRRVKDILNYTKGSLVVLDRLAGDRADLYVNGKCIAKGDIVVVDDSFGLRIAEIIEPFALEDIHKL